MLSGRSQDRPDFCLRSACVLPDWESAECPMPGSQYGLAARDITFRLTVFSFSRRHPRWCTGLKMFGRFKSVHKNGDSSLTCRRRKRTAHSRGFDLAVHAVALAFDKGCLAVLRALARPFKPQLWPSRRVSFLLPVVDLLQPCRGKLWPARCRR